jgi:hypothetical protein
MPIDASPSGTLDIENATLRSREIVALTNMVAGNDVVRSGGPALEVYGDPSHGGNEARLELVSNTANTISTSFTSLTSNAGVLSVKTGTDASDNGTITFGGFQNERLRITSDGNVGIGTASPDTKFTLYGDDTQDEGGLLMKVVDRLAFDNGFTGIGLGGYATTAAPIIQVAKSAIIHERTGYNGTGNLMFCNDGTTDNNDVSNTHARMTITGAGNVGIGKTDPESALDVIGNLDISGVSSGWRRQVFQDEYTTNVTKSWKRIAHVPGGSGVLRIHGVIGGHARNTTGEGQAIIDVMFVARSGADIKGYISGRIPTTTGLNIEARGTTGGGETGDSLTIYLVKEDYSAYNITCEAVHGVTIYDDDWSTTTPSESLIYNLANYAVSHRNNAIGNLHVHGNLSKNSGTFLIEHPLPEKKDTHNLCHSFIEGPKADLIYRGKAILENGIKTINIDTVSNMTEGTFAVLNGDVQCFTTNESDWDNVKGSVDGNILTIESQNTFSTSTVSWMVIGERRDPHMLNAPITDGDGHLITEPTKFEDITYDSYHEEVTSETTTVRSYLSGESL